MFFSNLTPPTITTMPISMSKVWIYYIILLFVVQFLWLYAYWIEIWDAKNTSQETTFITSFLIILLPPIWNKKSFGSNIFSSTDLLLNVFPPFCNTHIYTHIHTLTKRGRDHGKIMAIWYKSIWNKIEIYVSGGKI